MKQRLIQLIGLALLLVSPVLSQAQICYQYWIDDNKSAAVNGTTTDGTAINLSLDVAGLSPGAHFYNIRAKEGTSWGTLYRYLFCIPRDANASSTTLTKYEYWLDNDYVHRVSAEISGSEQSVLQTIDVSDMASGVHFYNMRTQDAAGHWGTTYRYLFCIPRETQPSDNKLIAGYRYGFGDDLKTVTFDTPVSEYTLQQQFDVPVPPPPTTIDDDCHFSFSGTTATLMRNVEMTFALTFTDEANAMSSPIGTSFTVTDTQTSDIVEMTVPGSQTIAAHPTGGYTVVSFTIPSAEEYVLKSTATACLRLFSSGGATLTTVDSESLTAGYSQVYEVGTYYAVVYGNTEETMLSVNSLVDRPSVGYAILDTETGTLTFKYGVMPAGDNVWETENTDFAESTPAPWDCANLINVIFDASYSNARPISTAYWFFYATKLTQITGLQYLNTSEVTDMYRMFTLCSSLTSLDVTHFDTSNVINMTHLFYGCKNLTSLDLSSFNTTKVTRMFGMFSGCRSLTSLDVTHFNTSNVTDMGAMFSGCSSLTSLDLSNFDTSNVTGMRSMFNDCSGLTSLNLSNFNTGNVTDMEWMFYHCSSLTSLDLNNFNTANVTTMERMFEGCSSLTSLDVSHFNTSKVTNMFWMFDDCSSLTSLDLSSFNPINVTDMGGMFKGCSSLTNLNVSNFNTANLTDMNSMFCQCSSLTSLDLSSFDTSNVTNMNGVFKECSGLTNLNLSNFNTNNAIGISEMFFGCSSLTSLDLSSFNPIQTISMFSMFEGCTDLKTIYVSEEWTTEAVTSGTKMFLGCTSLVGGKGTVYDENHTNKEYARVDGGPSAPGYLTMKGGDAESCGYAIFDSSTGTLTFKYGVKPVGENVFDTDDTSKAFADYDYAPWYWQRGDLKAVVFDASFAEARPKTTAYWFYDNMWLKSISGLEYLNTSEVGDMSNMFAKSIGLNEIDVSHFNTPKVTDMSYMFFECTSLDGLDLSSFNTENVTNMSSMFSNCWVLTKLDLSGFNTSNVTSMRAMFSSCEILTLLNVSSFNTSKVKDMEYMFTGCKSLKKLDLSSFNTGKVKTMNEMFYNCENVTSIDMSHFDTGNVTTMNRMFCNCKELTSLDLSSFNTLVVTDMGSMFGYCTKLSTIYAGDGWTVENVDSDILKSNMFYGCSSLVGGKGTAFDASHVSKDYARIDGGPSAPGYFTAKPPYTKGDVNGDGDVDIADAVCVVNHVVGKPNATFIEAAADANGDGDIDIADAVHIVNYVVGKISALAPRFDWNLPEPE